MLRFFSLAVTGVHRLVFGNRRTSNRRPRETVGPLFEVMLVTETGGVTQVRPWVPFSELQIIK
jgi:hypothetical protein